MDTVTQLRIKLFAEEMSKLVLRFFPEDDGAGVAFVCGISSSTMEIGEHALLSSLDKAGTAYALRTMKEEAEQQLIQYAVERAREQATVNTLAHFAVCEKDWPAGSIERTIVDLTKVWLADEKPEGYDEAATTTQLQELVDQLNIAYADPQVIESDSDNFVNPKFN